MNKKNLYRVIALGLTGIMAAGTICQPVKAAAIKMTAIAALMLFFIFIPPKNYILP